MIAHGFVYAQLGFDDRKAVARGLENYQFLPPVDESSNFQYLRYFIF